MEKCSKPREKRAHSSESEAEPVKEAGVAATSAFGWDRQSGRT